MLTATRQDDPQQTGERRALMREHLRALAKYGAMGVSHHFAVAFLDGLLRLGEQVIWRTSKCGVCRGKGWVRCPVRLAVPCGVCGSTGLVIG